MDNKRRKIYNKGSRSQRILELATVPHNIFLPKFDTTKGTDENTKKIAIAGYNELHPKKNIPIEMANGHERYSKDKSPVNERIPSTSSYSKQKLNGDERNSKDTSPVNEPIPSIDERYFNDTSPVTEPIPSTSSYSKQHLNGDELNSKDKSPVNEPIPSTSSYSKHNLKGDERHSKDKSAVNEPIFSTSSYSKYNLNGDERYFNDASPLNEPIPSTSSYSKQNSTEENGDQSDSEDKTSGSEYLPSDCSSESDTEVNLKNRIRTKKLRKVSNKVEGSRDSSKFISLKFSAEKAVNNNENVTKNRLPIQRSDTLVVAAVDSANTAHSVGLTVPSNVNEEDLKINYARKTDIGKRIRDKRHSCYFCQKEVINVARHLEVKHGEELDVAKLLVMPKNSQQRRQGFTEIVRAGDFYHNCNVTAIKQGELILVRRPTSNEVKFVTYSDYGPCPNCLGFMMKKHLWHHTKTICKKLINIGNESSALQNRHIIAESNAILSSVFGTEFTTDYKTYIVNCLREDDAGNYCREDLLILKFGAMLFEKYGITQCELIRQLMRQMARLVLMIRESSIQKHTLRDLLVPEKFDLVVQGTKNLCGSITSSITKRPEFEVPSLALKIGHSLKKCANIERGLALRNHDLKKNETLLSFLNLLDLEWQTRISSNALATLYKRKLNVGQLLPITSDLKKLNEHIDMQINKSRETLTKTSNIGNWSYLASLTLCRIILFNKRRAGEASRMTTEQYLTQPSRSQQSNEELKDSLTPYERKLAERLTVINVVGKRGRKVPVILTPEVQASIDILVKFRNSCGIAENNPYIFARGNYAVSNMRGHDCLRKIISEVELEKPEYITGTKLRKYVATVCQIFNLTENEHDWLARHLGHDITVHREFYRLHEDTVELTKVSRLLMAIDKGEASKFAGKTLKDIHIEDLPPIEEDDTEPNILEDVETENVDVTGQTLDINESVTSRKETVANSNMQLISRSKKALPRGKKQITEKKLWTAEEKRVVFDFFKIQIKNGIVPGKKDCETCQGKHPLLQERKWSDLKFCVKNQITKITKIRPK